MSNNDYNLDKEIEEGLALAEKMLRRKRSFIVIGVFVGVTLLMGIVFGLPTITATNKPTLAPTAINTKTKTLAFTATHTSTSTPTQKPTSTPTLPPTSTSTPKPAKVGETISGDGFEFTVVNLVYREQLHFSSYQYYYPKDGFVFLEVVIRIQNSNPQTPLNILWEKVIAFEDDENTMPYWTYIKYVETGETMSSARFPYIEYNASDIHIENKHDAYVKAIFIVGDSNESVLLGIKNSPLVDVTTE